MPRPRLRRRIEVDTANVNKVCLLGKEESFFEGMSMIVRSLLNGRDLK